MDLYIKVGIAETEIRETVIDDAGVDPATPERVDLGGLPCGRGCSDQLPEGPFNLGLRLDYSVHDAKLRVESWDTASLSVLYRF